MDLDPARVAEAHRLIDPVFVNTPQYVDEALSRHLGQSVVVKLETANPIRSFKGRGADFMLSTLRPGTRVVCASSGNFGQGVAYAARARGMRADVFAPDDVNVGKRARMEALGAHVTLAGADSSEIHAAAASFAATRPDTVYVVDGRDPAIAEGAGTIGLELAREDPFDAIVLPVGDGALIAGVACWIRTHSPRTRIIGVNPAGAPAMQRSVQAGEPVTLDTVTTIADGMNIRMPWEESVRRVAEVVDDIVLVDDDAIMDAVVALARMVGVLAEPAGASGIAAISQGLVPGGRLATVVTGANPRQEIIGALMTRLGQGEQGV